MSKLYIPRLGDLIIFPDKSIGYVYRSKSKKINKINFIDLELKLVPDTDYLRKSWATFYMVASKISSSFHGGFTAEISDFTIQKFGCKVTIAATHKAFNECLRLSGWEIVPKATHHNQGRYKTKTNDTSNFPS